MKLVIREITEDCSEKGKFNLTFLDGDKAVYSKNMFASNLMLVLKQFYDEIAPVRLN